MPMSTIGDLRQHFTSTRNTTELKTDLATLVDELTTGQVSDLTAHLGSSQTQLAGVDRQLQMLETFSQANVETAQVLSTMQLALGNIEQNRSSVTENLLLIDSASSLSQIDAAGAAARYGFEATVQSLNMRSGDRSLFGGNDPDTAPLASAADMLDALELSIAGLTEVDDISTAIDDWFSATGGGFDTTAYQGDTAGFSQRPVAAGQSIEIKTRADDTVFRDTLKAFATATIAGNMEIALTSETRTALQAQSGEALLSNAAPLANLQGQLGYAEAQVEDASVLNASQQSSYGIARNTLVSADPFETATRLQEVQTLLETQYTLTARLSRLSLTEYLR